MKQIGFILRGDSKSQKYVMQANLRLLDLLEYAEFTYMTDPSDNPYDLEGTKKSENEYYQRRIEVPRVKEIQKYIRNSILSSEISKIALFPTTILLAAHWETNALNVGDVLDVENFYKEVISLYIVDGQHRLYSLMTLYKSVVDSTQEDDIVIRDYLESYHVNSMILINFDLWEQAKVFADVNFNQKKVNKSIYYSIFGMHVPEGTDDVTHTNIYIAHQLVRYLNTNPQSPLYHCIKMLGVGNGYISQAFFADALIKNFHPRGIWYLDPDRDISKDNYYYMAAEIMDYFDIIKTKLASMWPQSLEQTTSILLKTTGIGALLWLMAYIHRTQLSGELRQKMKTSYDEVKDRYRMIVSRNIEKIESEAESLFSINGMYGGSGGRGIEGNLRKRLQEIVDA